MQLLRYQLEHYREHLRRNWCIIKGIKNITGLLKLAKDKKYLSKRELKIANYFIAGQYGLIKMLVNNYTILLLLIRVGKK